MCSCHFCVIWDEVVFLYHPASAVAPQHWGIHSRRKWIRHWFFYLAKLTNQDALCLSLSLSVAESADIRELLWKCRTLEVSVYQTRYYKPWHFSTQFLLSWIFFISLIHRHRGTHGTFGFQFEKEYLVFRDPPLVSLLFILANTWYAAS